MDEKRITQIKPLEIILSVCLSVDYHNCLKLLIYLCTMSIVIFWGVFIYDQNFCQQLSSKISAISWEFPQYIGSII